ncbi:MerR family transcriptional regulator [Streptomyces sp. NPDC049906]|uniref:MerR family transcriptional regulator n=1 Tax=Streptomyces sp. NPDC049906 TaxID=3155656 RepID=UPI0034180F55
MPEVPPAPALTTGAVARRLGVAPTTLRSWDRRYGLGPAHHEGGRHRRWTPGDIAVLEAMCRLTASGVPPAEAARAARTGPVPPPPTPAGPRLRNHGALPLGRVGPECRGLARAAVRLDADAVDELLAHSLAAHGLLFAWDEVMMPALRAVGRKWQSSDGRYVEVEHLLSWHISSALRRVPPTRPGPRHPAGPVLAACAPGELHTLPLEALTAGLLSVGLPVRMLGGAVPARALDEAVHRSGPVAVVLWSQSRTTADRALLRRTTTTTWGVRGARRTPAVLAAGPGWAGPAPEGALRPTTLAGALRMLRELYADGAAQHWAGGVDPHGRSAAQPCGPTRR